MAQRALVALVAVNVATALAVFYSLYSGSGAHAAPPGPVISAEQRQQHKWALGQPWEELERRVAQSQRQGRRVALVVLGTRPEAVKLAPVIEELRARQRKRGGLECVAVSTGQHREMLAQTLGAFGLGGAVDVDLGLMRGNQTLQALTLAAVDALRAVVERLRPAVVVVQGDTTTSFAASLAAFLARVPVAHVEAGLRTRSLRQPFPEEFNRQAIGLVASLHFAATPWAARNLLAECKDPDTVLVTGNTVVDALRSVLGAAPRSAALADLLARARSRCAGAAADEAKGGSGSDCRVALLTAHRRESFGAPLRVWSVLFSCCGPMDHVLEELRARVSASYAGADWGLDAPAAVVCACAQAAFAVDPRSRQTASLIAAPLRQPSGPSTPRIVELRTDAPVMPLAISVNSNSTMLLLVGSDRVFVVPVVPYDLRRPTSPVVTVPATEVGADVIRDVRFAGAGRTSRAVVDARWHPWSPRHVAVLSSDGVVRVYDVSADASRVDVELRAPRPISAFAWAAPGGVGWSRFCVWAALQGSSSLCAFCPVVLPGLSVAREVLEGLREMATSSAEPGPAELEMLDVLEQVAQWPLESDVVRLRCPERLHAPPVRVFSADPADPPAVVSAMACIDSRELTGLVVCATADGRAKFHAFFDASPPFLSKSSLVTIETLDLQLDASSRKNDAEIVLVPNPADPRKLYMTHREGAHEISLEWLRELEAPGSRPTLSAGTASQLFRVSPAPEPAIGLAPLWDPAERSTRLLVVSLSGATQLLGTHSAASAVSGALVGEDEEAMPSAAALGLPKEPCRVPYVRLPEDPAARLEALLATAAEWRQRHMQYCEVSVADMENRYESITQNLERFRETQGRLAATLSEVAQQSEGVAQNLARVVGNHRNLEQRIEILFDIWKDVQPEKSQAEIRFEAELRDKLHSAKRLNARADELSLMADKCVKAAARAEQQKYGATSQELADLGKIVADEHREIAALRDSVVALRDAVGAFEGTAN
eukprot:m51a1_g10119 hypothetical protein (999) ;mRNA; f:40854-45575